MELCKTCHAGSCRRYNPYLWGSDIIRIYEALKVDISFFTHAFQLNEKLVEEYKSTEPLFIFTDSGKEEYYALILKTTESTKYPGTLKCIFLQEWETSRCGIYSIRPTNCAAWPAGYDENMKKVIIKDPYLILEKKHKRASDSPAYNLCPKPLIHADYAKFQESYVKNAIINHHEKIFFIQVAKKWNQNPDVSDRLYDFLVKEYNNRIEHIKDE